MNETLSALKWLDHCFSQSVHNQPPWLAAFRQQQFEKFSVRGLPTRHEEWWKYTRIIPLVEKMYSLSNLQQPAFCRDDWPISLVFINGHFNERLSDHSLLPPEVIFSSLNTALPRHESLIKPYLLHEFDTQRYPFATLNAALTTDGVFLYVPKNCIVPQLIHLIFFNTEQNGFIACPRNIIIADQNSQVVLLEDYRVGSSENYFINTVTELYAHDNAQVDYYKLQNEHPTATHIANVFVQQKRDSWVNTFFADWGGQGVREEVTVNLHEPGATCRMNGLYLLNQAEQHIDNHIYVDHVAAHCTSSILYKGILDKKTQAVFNGKVYAHPGAQQTQAQQANHNLLLSAEAEVNTKPELEIYADDVKCTHGATVGQLDKNALFYLRSRGIEQDAALKLLTRGFMGEVLNQITEGPIRDYIQLRVGQHE
jgi:Fe-S cluster assembly protein SufD